MAVIDMDRKALALQGPHGRKSFLLIGPPPAHPDLHVGRQPSFAAGIAKPSNNPREGLLYIGEVRNGPAHDNPLNAGEDADPFRESLHSPVWRSPEYSA